MVPAGARISAGNSGSVDRSLPNSALTRREPVAGELHAVAGVAGEAEDHPVQLRLGVGASVPVSVIRHPPPRCTDMSSHADGHVASTVHR